MHLSLVLCCLAPLLGNADDSRSLNIEFKPSAFSKDLTQQTVGQTFQDSRGVLWFVTQEGLNKYNGHELENYRFSTIDPQSISTDYITGIAEDVEGDLWISTLGGGLNRYNPITNNFSALYFSASNLNTPLSNNIYTVFADSSGLIWLGYENGFSTFNPKEHTFRHFTQGATDQPHLGIVEYFAQTSQGTIWAATAQNGLMEIDQFTHKVISHNTKEGSNNPAISDSIFRIIADRNDRLWILSEKNGVELYDPEANTVAHFRHNSGDTSSLSSDTVRAIYEDAQGKIWIGTSEGLNLFLPESDSFQRFTRANSELPSDQIYSVYQSREGTFWIGTFFGLATGSEAMFRKVNVINGQLSSDSVNAFSETLDGSLWIGTGDGLNRLRPGQQGFEWLNESTYPKISSPEVMSLLAEDSTLWVGTFDGGLSRINLSSNTITEHKHNPLDRSSIGANGITSILRTSEGQLILGTFGGGISLYQEDTKTFVNLTHIPGDPTSLSNSNVIALYQDSLGMIWVGTENGLNRFYPETGKFERFYTERGNSDSLSSDMVWAFFEDDKQQLWLGTRGGGLNRWDVEDRKRSIGKFHHFSENISLPSSNIYGIQMDSKGNLWLSHNRGVTKLDPSTLAVHQYGVQDGLQDTEFNMGASFQSQNGDIYFGGNRGYNIISAHGLQERILPPSVSISEIKIMNQRMEFDVPYYKLEKLELGYEDIMVSIDFFAADYSNPDLVRYAYKLEGLNSDWIVSSEAHTASFTTLPPGTYNLRLAAASPDGIWNWNGLNLPIVVSPPPWLSPLAYLTYTLLAFSAVGLIFQRQRRLSTLALERQRELEAKVQERTADLQESRLIAEEASKAKSEFLATMSHEIRTPMHGMIGMTELLLHTKLTEQQQRFASAAHNSGEALLELINTILDFSKIEAAKVELERVEFSLVELIDEICYLQGEPAQRRGLSLNSIFSTSVPERVIGDPTKIRQVVLNLISNALKFTHEGNVNVRVTSESVAKRDGQALIHISVQDDGIGMDSETQTRVFEAFTQADTSTTREYGGTGLGLAISRHYIDMMGGTIKIESEVGRGSNITVSIPLKIVDNLQQQNGNLAHHSAMIMCDNLGTVEMVSSHLSRAGISCTTVTDPALFFANNSPNTLRILDYDTHRSSVSPAEVETAGLLSSYRGIILMPLTEIELPEKFSNWVSLSKPLTTKSLEGAISKLTELSELSVPPEPQVDEATANGVARILVAEDVVTNQKIAQEMIQMLGCEVVIANNGEEAISKYLDGQFDLIFMDCQMPLVDGYEATRRIRELERENHFQPIPIVALTAGINKVEKARCSEAGMNRYLTKPFSISELTEVLRDFLGESIGKNIGATDIRMEPSSDNTAVANERANGRLEVINQQAVDNIREVEKQTGRSILPTIFDGFTSQMIEKLEELDKDFRSGDPQAIYRTAHAIKSMSANIGAEQVRRHSAIIESTGRSGSTEGVAEHIVSLKKAYDEFVLSFAAELADQNMLEAL